MQTASSVFEQTIASMEDDELVERWRNQMFSEEASPIAAAELKKRGIDPSKHAIHQDIAPPEEVSDFCSSERPLYSQLFSFRGRASRVRFWSIIPAAWVAFAVLQSYLAFSLRRPHSGPSLILLFAILIPVAWLHWATVVQRLHDRNKSGSWCALLFVPIAGMVWAVIELGCMPGTAGANRFGKR